MKRTAAKSGKGAKKIKLYKYSNQLSFLQKYLDESFSNIENQTGDTLEEELDEFYAGNICDVYTEENLENETTKERVQKPTTQINKNTVSTFRFPSSPCVKAVKKITKTNTNEENVSLKLMDFLIKYKQNPKPAEHPVDAFLSAMAPSLKTLSQYNWHLAKSEIFSVVQKYELKTITGQLQPDDISGSPTNPRNSATPPLSSSVPPHST